MNPKSENKEGFFSGIPKLLSRKTKQQIAEQEHLQKDLVKILQTPDFLKKAEMDIAKPRAWPIEKQMELIDAWLTNHPNRMPNLVSRIISPSTYGRQGESNLDTKYLRRVSALRELFEDNGRDGDKSKPLPNQEKYSKVVDLCVDDFLQGKVPSLGKGYIKLALRAVKEGKLDQTHYDKVMKAGMEVIVTS